MDDDFVGDDVKMKTHVFKDQHGGVELEIDEVDAQKLSPRGADDGVDEVFGCGEISRWCAFVAWIVDVIAVNSEPNAMLLLFLQSIIVAYAALGGGFVSWNMRFGDEKACVSVRDVSDTLEDLPKFVFKTVCPNVLVFVQFDILGHCLCCR